MKLIALIIVAVPPCLALCGCADVQRSAYYPDRVSVSLGAGANFDRQDRENGPRTMGFNVAIIPSWRLKPALTAPVHPPMTSRREEEAP